MGVRTQQFERLIDRDATTFSQNAFGLLDGQTVVERGLQLLCQQIALACGAFVQQPNGGHVGQRLPNRQSLGIKTTARRGEQVHASNSLLAQPH